MRNKNGRTFSADSEVHYIVDENKNSVVLAHEQINRWNRNERPEVNPNMHQNFVRGKAGILGQWGK